MNKIFQNSLLGVAAAAALLLAGCQNFNNTGAPVDQNSTFAPTTSRLSVRMTLPAGEAVHYPKTRALHDAREWTISTLTLFVFDTQTQKLILDPITIQGTALTAATSVNAETGDFDYTYDFTEAQSVGLEGRTMVDIYAVANEPTFGATLGKDDPVSKLLDLRASRTQTDNASAKEVVGGDGTTGTSDDITMTGQAIQVPLSNQQISIELRRIVARVDIINNVAPREDGTARLTIKKVELTGANHQSMLLPLSGSRKLTANKVAATPFALTETDTGTSTVYQRTYQKVFYLYENYTGDLATSSAPVIKIHATYFGQDKIYTIPFERKGVELKDAVLRNHLYRIVLGTPGTPVVPGAELKFSIEDTPWNEHSIYQYWAPFSVAFKPTSPAAAGVSYDAKAHTLTLPATAGEHLFGYSHSYGTAPTVTITPDTEAAAWITTATRTGGELSLQVTANDTGSTREGIVRIKHDKKADYEYVIKVIQGA